MDVLFEMAKIPAGEGILWPPFNLLLLKRLLDAGYILAQQPQGGFVSIGGMVASPFSLILQDAGRAFLGEIGTHEL
jgi:hypothetical protein